MSRCPQCGRLLFPDEETCLACRKSESVSSDAASLAARPADEWGDRAAIARFQNGAEAGYFADELTRTAAISADVLARERFDAVHAAWSIDYVLLVNREQAQTAARALQTLVETTSDESTDADDDHTARELPGGVWMPMILTLAAGSIACFGIDRADRPAQPQALVVRDPDEPPNLWHVLGASRGVWRQTLDNGRGERTLSIDPQTRRALLTEDQDGDGRPDCEWRFDWSGKSRE